MRHTPRPFKVHVQMQNALFLLKLAKINILKETRKMGMGDLMCKVLLYYLKYNNFTTLTFIFCQGSLLLAMSTKSYDVIIDGKIVCRFKH